MRTPPAIFFTTDSFGHFNCANGIITKRTGNSIGETRMSAAENHPSGVSGWASATFKYDGDKNRVKGRIRGTTTISIDMSV